MSLVGLTGTHPQLSAEQQQMVLDTLRSVLDSPHFCKSKRYPALLEFAVRAALDENSNPLKERTVGVEVFGRLADYDTSTDPVVRIAAGEVRRRMALYFSEHAEAPVRIDLPAGSYKAEFRFRADSSKVISFQQPQTSVEVSPDELPTGAAAARLASGLSSRTQSELKSDGHWWSTKLAIGSAIILLLIVTSVAVWRHQHNSNQGDFWWPVLHGNQDAMILVGKTGVPISGVANGGQLQPATSSPSQARDLALNDAIVTAQICSAFREYKRGCTVSPAELAKVEDLHGKSVVLVGGFNNPWTRRFLAPLRYQLQSAASTETGGRTTRTIIEHEPTGDVSLATIIGSDDPAADFSNDYAIVARFHSDITDGMTVVVAGLGRPGTTSAGQYVSSPDLLRELYAQAPKDWKGINFEAVLKIDVVQGSSNHVEVIASRFW